MSNTSNTTPITLYGIPNCDSVKKARAWFVNQNIDYVFHDFKKQGVPPTALELWLQHMGWELLINRKGTTWRKLDAAVQMSVIDAASARTVMRAYPSMIKRPVVVKGPTVIVGVQPQAWAALITSAHTTQNTTD